LRCANSQWRWQERFAAGGFEGLLRDKTRPSRIARLDPAIAERVVALTMDPRGRARQTHSTGAWHFLGLAFIR
jgi:hypothetical protein